MNMKTSPSPAAIAKRNAFLRMMKKASFAATQKLFPVMAIWM